nr:putative zinc finger, CCHC-type [Tanacetum cinerariifolium]
MEPLHTHEMLKELKTLFAQQAEQELLQTTRDFHSCRQEEGQSVSSYVLKMNGYIDNLEHLGHLVTLGLGLHKQTLPKSNASALHAIRAGKVQKGNKHKKSQSQTAAKGHNHGKRKNKQAYAPKPKIPPPPKRENLAKDSIYHESSGAGGSGIFVIELNAILNRSWIYDTGCEIVLNTCHYALSITRGVIFISRLYEDGFVNRFVNNTIQVSRNNMVYFSAIPRDGIFEIDLSNFLTNESFIYAVSNKRAKLDLDSALLWHCRLGHISKKRIEKLQHDGLLDSSDLRAFEKCVFCMSGKMTRKRYTHQVERAKDLLGLIHTDVCGPFKIMSRQGASYFVTFTDDFSRYGYVYLLKHKHEVFKNFKVFQKEVENRLGKTIKSLRSDRGGEYMSQEFLDHLKDHGIIAHRSPPYTPQHNVLLGLCTETTACILNMVPTKKVEKTPYEVWHGKAPKLSYLKVWSCEALVKRDTLTKPDKLEPRSIKCIFVGYAKETMGYYFYYPPENKVLVSRNAEFLENSLIDQEASGSLEDLEIIQEEDTHPSLDTSINHKEDDLEIDEPQKNSLIDQEASGSLEDLEIIQEEDTHPSLDTSINHKEDDLEIDEPQSDIVPIRRGSWRTHYYKATLLDPESKKWLNAMNVEMQSMKDNKVWVLVELPPNGKTVGSKWFFKKKTDMDGNVHIYKARLAAKGYTQTLGIDYEETFSPIADIRAIRILIAIAAYYDYEIWQMDVKIAFLNGYLNEEVYMEQHEGFVNPKYPNRVCKLKRSIYGLKQASRQWNKRFDDEIEKFGFTQNRDEPCVYLKASGSNITFLILYVDDILIMGNSIPMLQSVKTYIGKCFAMKDLGKAAYIIGIKIYIDRSKRLIGLYQSAYIEKILKRYCMENSKRKSIPMQEKLKLSKSQEAEYIAAFDASKEAVWVRKFIYRLGVVPIIKEPISMYCDNTESIAIANEFGITKECLINDSYLPDKVQQSNGTLSDGMFNHRGKDNITSPISHPVIHDLTMPETQHANERQRTPGSITCNDVASKNVGNEIDMLTTSPQNALQNNVYNNMFDRVKEAMQKYNPSIVSSPSCPPNSLLTCEKEKDVH